MTLLDLWTAGAAGAAGLCLAVRANMLKPKFSSWSQAPDFVWLSVFLLSAVMFIVAATVWRGQAAGWREAAICTGLAIYAAVLLVNLSRQTGGAAEDAPDSAEAAAAGAGR